MDPRPRFRRSLFGYRPAQVRAFVESATSEQAAADDAAALEVDLRSVEEELQRTRAELTARSAALRAAEEATLEATQRTGEAEDRAAELEADLRRAGERLDGRGEDVRAAERQVESLTSKLDALRSALTVEITKVWTAELRGHELGTELALARDELREARERVDAERERADRAERRAEDAERRIHRLADEAHAAPWTTDELAPVFDLTERTVTGILAEARRRGDAELHEVEARLELLRSETRQLESWRDRVEPLVTPVRRSVEQARLEAERVGGLVRQALEPMTAAVTMLGERLVELAAAAGDADEDEETRTPRGSTPRGVPDEADLDAPDDPAGETIDPVAVADGLDEPTPPPRIVNLSDAPADSSTG